MSSQQNSLSMLIPILSALVAVLILPIHIVAQATVGISCYGYGGEFEYVNNTLCPGSNACCGFKATCLGNRLCHNPDDGANVFVRGPCAVRPYDVDSCAKICLYDEADANYVLPRVTVCADGSYCCSNDQQCCTQSRGVFLDENGNIAQSAASTTFSYGPERTASTFTTGRTTSSSTSSSSTESTSTSGISSSTQVAASGTTSPTPVSGTSGSDSSSGSNGSAESTVALKVGLGLGIPLAALVAGLGIWMFLRKRYRAKQEAGSGHFAGTGSVHYTPTSGYSGPIPAETPKYSGAGHYSNSYSDQPVELPVPARDRSAEMY